MRGNTLYIFVIFIFCCVLLTCLGVDLGPARAAANPGPDPSASPSQDQEVNLAAGVRATSRDQHPINYYTDFGSLYAS